MAVEQSLKQETTRVAQLVTQLRESEERCAGLEVALAALDKRQRDTESAAEARLAVVEAALDAIDKRTEALEKRGGKVEVP